MTPRIDHEYPQAPTYALAVLGYIATGRVHELPDGDLVIRIGNPARYRRVSPESYSLIQRRRIELRHHRTQARERQYDKLDALIAAHQERTT